MSDLNDVQKRLIAFMQEELMTRHTPTKQVLSAMSAELARLMAAATVSGMEEGKQKEFVEGFLNMMRECINDGIAEMSPVKALLTKLRAAVSEVTPVSETKKKPETVH